MLLEQRHTIPVNTKAQEEPLPATEGSGNAPCTSAQ